MITRATTAWEHDNPGKTAAPGSRFNVCNKRFCRTYISVNHSSDQPESEWYMADGDRRPCDDGYQDEPVGVDRAIRQPKGREIVIIGGGTSRTPENKVSGIVTVGPIINP